MKQRKVECYDEPKGIEIGRGIRLSVLKWNRVEPDVIFHPRFSFWLSSCVPLSPRPRAIAGTWVRKSFGSIPKSTFWLNVFLALPSFRVALRCILDCAVWSVSCYTVYLTTFYQLDRLCNFEWGTRMIMCFESENVRHEKYVQLFWLEAERKRPFWKPGRR